MKKWSFRFGGNNVYSRGLQIVRKYGLTVIIPGYQHLFQDSLGVTPAAKDAAVGYVEDFLKAPENLIPNSMMVGASVTLGSELYLGTETPTIENYGGSAGAWNGATKTFSNTVAGTDSSYPRLPFVLSGLTVGQVYRVSGRLSGNSASKITRVRLANGGENNDILFDPTTGIFSGEATCAYARLQFISDGRTVWGGVVLEELSVKQVTLGVFPTGWSKTDAEGVTVSCVGASEMTLPSGQVVPAVDVRFSGTATATTNLYVNTYNASTEYTPAKAGELFSTSLYAALLSGSISASIPCWSLVERSSNGSGLVLYDSSMSSVSGTVSRFAVSRILTNASTALANSYLRVPITSGTTLDFTLRIAAPQLERGNVTGFTPTYGTAIDARSTHPLFYQATSGNKPLLRQESECYLSFDGTTDYLQGSALPWDGDDDHVVVAGARCNAAGAVTQGIFGVASTSGAARYPVLYFDATTGKIWGIWRNDSGAYTNITHTTAIIGQNVVAACTKVGNNKKLFVNGKQSGATDTAALGTTTPNACTLGGWNQGSTTVSRFLDGNLCPIVFGKLQPGHSFTDNDCKILQDFVNLFTKAPGYGQ